MNDVIFSSALLGIAMTTVFFFVILCRKSIRQLVARRWERRVILVLILVLGAYIEHSDSLVFPSLFLLIGSVTGMAMMIIFPIEKDEENRTNEKMALFTVSIIVFGLGLFF